MRIAVQIGLAWFVGLVATLGVGFLVWLAFALRFLPGVLFTIAALVIVLMGIGAATVEGHWAWRLGWGAIVAVFGFAVATFAFAALSDTKVPQPFNFVVPGLPFALVAAVLSNNVWVRIAGGSLLVAGLLVAPSDAWPEFAEMWSSLHF